MEAEEMANLTDHVAGVLTRFTQTRDPVGIFRDDTSQAAARLLTFMLEQQQRTAAVDARTVHVLAWLHWYRYQLLVVSDDDGADDFELAVALFASLSAAGSGSVPTEVRAYLGMADRHGDQNPADRAADLVEEYERTGRAELLDSAVELMSGELADERYRDMVTVNLTYALLLRFDNSGRISDLERAILLARQALASATERPLVLSHLGNALSKRYEAVGAPEDLEEAIALLSEALDGTDPADPDHRMILNNLGSTLHLRFNLTDRLADLDKAIEVSEMAVRQYGENDFMRPAALSNYGVKLHDRFERTGQPDDLSAAVTAHEQAIDMTSPTDPYLGIRLSNLASALASTAELTGSRDAVNKAIDVARRGVEIIPVGHASRPGLLDTLANLLGSRFRLDNDGADLAASIELHQQAVSAAGPHDPDKARYLNNLGIALQERFKWGRDPEDLNAAVAAGQKAANDGRIDSTSRATHRSNLALALLLRFDHQVDPTDLDDAITVAKEALAATASSATTYARYHLNVGAMFHRRYKKRGDRADIAEAVRHTAEAVEATPAGHPELSGRLSALGVALSDRFELTGDGDDLERSIEVSRQAVDAAAADPQRFAILANYGVLLWTRYRWMRQLTDLDTAIDLLGRAIQMAPAEHPHLAAILTNHATLLNNRFEVSGDQADLDQAIADARQGMELVTASGSDRSGDLSGLGILLRNRFTSTGDPADIDEAVALSRQAVDAATRGGLDRTHALSNLSYALRVRFEATRHREDVDEAIRAAEMAVLESPGESFDAGVALTNLAVALRLRSQLPGRSEDLRTAVERRRTAAHIEASPVRFRITAAAAWGRWAFEAGDMESAFEGYARAVSLLPEAAWYGLDDQTRRSQLSEWQGLAVDAASCAIAVGRPQQAIELLEQGRSVLWTQTLNLRSSSDELAAQAPTLAVRLQEVLQALDMARFGSDSPTWVPIDSSMVSAHDASVAAERRRGAARELDEVLQEIRQLDGFADFFRATPFDRLRQAAAEGPVVVLNTGELGSHALILRHERDTEIVVVPLTDAPAMDALTKANEFLGLLRRDHVRDRTFLERERDRHAVFDLLDWLWDAVAAPVLAGLGQSPEIDDGSPQRIWWCPTGLWSVLPLHAAGRYPRSRAVGESAATLSARVISSYTPTLSDLIRARSDEPEEFGAARLLAVGVPAAEGADPLPAVPAELAVVERFFPPPLRGRRMMADEANIRDVTSALPEYSWVHFSCHGSQNREDPSRSALLLSDGPLTVDDLARLRTGSAEFAFLSACETTAGDTRLLDEALHIAAAFRLVGYRHVIASLWHIRDAPTPEFADALYSHLTTAGRSSYSLIASALHEAVAHLRRAYPDQPLVWAPYVHSGP